MEHCHKSIGPGSEPSLYCAVIAHPANTAQLHKAFDKQIHTLPLSVTVVRIWTKTFSCVNFSVQKLPCTDSFHHRHWSAFKIPLVKLANHFYSVFFCCVIVWNPFNQSYMSSSKPVFVTRVYAVLRHAILFLSLSTLCPPLHFSRTAKLSISPVSICTVFNQPGLLYPSEGYHRSGYYTSNATPFVGDLHTALRGLGLHWPLDNALERYFKPECSEVCFCS